MSPIEPRSAERVSRIGMVVHPSRNIDAPLRELRAWADRHDIEIVQIAVVGQNRAVAEPGDARDCDLVVSIGGDGTMLAAIRAAVMAGRPVMGVACGSLGVLTTVGVQALPEALDGFCRGEWIARELPALSVRRGEEPEAFAINDISVTRAGIGQVRVTAQVDGMLFSRLAGDGCIVSTPLGSSAYSLAAGGPLLTPDTQAYLLTPLPTHGGSRQSLVISAASRLTLEIGWGVGGARLEVDGQIADTNPPQLEVTLQPTVATLVTFEGQESLFAGLRRRQIIVDSPRIAAEHPKG